MAGTDSRPGRFWLALAAAAALALVLRLAYLTELGGTPVLAGLMGDSRSYDAWAQRIAGGEWLGTEVFYQTPDEHGGDQDARFNVGAVIDFSDLHHLMFSAGRGFVGPNVFQSYVAYQVTFGPKK